MIIAELEEFFKMMLLLGVFDEDSIVFEPYDLLGLDFIIEYRDEYERW
ncbi:hypothetical protein KAR91_22450 [Candidatus Pacearchaeota archaeon]|nr:hypothetical protein [Candidatus Pacearchaeota archaeon]